MEGDTYELYGNLDRDEGYKVWTHSDGTITADGEFASKRFAGAADFLIWIEENDLEYEGTERY